jgi:hypothetical protein
MRPTGLRAEAFVHVCTVVSTLGINKSFGSLRHFQMADAAYF